MLASNPAGMNIELFLVLDVKVRESKYEINLFERGSLKILSKLQTDGRDTKAI